MMMSSEKEGGSMGKKITSSSKPQQAAASQINCPRCDSPNTKFCYYNNYSLSQPRHFCKTCRRYWTKGGSLRNVPIGGGCRKNKKMIMKPSSSSVVSCDHRSSDSAAPCDRIGGLNVPSRCLTSHGFSAWWPVNNFPRLQSSDTDDIRLIDPNHFSNTRSPPISSNFSLDPPGSSNFPLSFASGIFREMGSSSFNSSPSLASSIESLSTINQDLHWKLQQQRLAMLCVGDNEKENDASTTTRKLSGTVEIETHHVQKPQPILFQNLETDDDQSYCGIQDVSRKESGVGGTLATEWFFDNSFASVNPTPETSSSNMISNENPSNWNGGIQAWSDLAHFTALP